MKCIPGRMPSLPTLVILFASLLAFDPSPSLGEPAGAGLSFGDVAGEGAGRVANFELASKWTQDSLFARAYYLRVPPHWTEDGDIFWYRYKTSDGFNYYLVDPAKKTKKPLFDRWKVAADLTAITGKPHNGKDLDLQDLKMSGDGGSMRFTLDGCGYEYVAASGKTVFTDSVSAKPESAAWKNVSPDGEAYVFTRGNNLFAGRMSDPDSDAVQVTFDGEKYFGWPADGPEGIDNGEGTPRYAFAEWSEDSRFFCIIRSDLRKVKDLWVIDSLNEPRPSLKTYKCAMPGEEVQKDELWVYDRDSGAIVRVDIDRWDSQTMVDLFEKTVYWRKDSKKLLFIRRSRDFFMVDLCEADPVTGKSRVLVEERMNAQVLIRPPVEIGNAGEILWWSRRDGRGHYYRYDNGGRLINRVTGGAFHVERIKAVDEKRGLVFFLANGREEERNPYYEHLYRVNLGGGGLRLLTPEDAFHDVDICASAGYFVDNYSRVDAAPVSVLRDSGGGLVMELERSDMSRLDEAGWRMPEIFRAKAADGATDLWGVMYKPFDFDPGIKYPVITRVYPGKFSELVPLEFSPWGYDVYMAQLGFIVVMFGNRGGSDHRSLWYKEFGRDNMRDYGLADKVAVIGQLAARFDFIDPGRVGILGGSSGGFMTVSAMLQYPDFFKVGVSRAGLQDGNKYFNIWNERYAGVKMIEDGVGAVRWESVRTPTNIELAGSLKGRLLLIHGDVDDNCNPSQTYLLAKALIDAGKRFDMFIVPGSDHSFRETHDYLSRLTALYFVEHLMGDHRDFIDINTEGQEEPGK